MGSVTFHDSYTVSGFGYSEQNIRINFSESYNASTNSTTVTFSSCEIASNYFLGNCVIRGETQFNGSAVKSYPTTTSSYTASIGGGTDNYATVTGGSGSSITVTHDASGRASFTVKLVALEGSYFGAAYRGKMFGVAGGTSKSVSLTSHSSTLTVNPNGGTWNGSTSSQIFSQAPTTTRTIASPTRTGYTFAGWSLSGGGSFSGTTYTYGASSGTLTAQWRINTYNVDLTAGEHIASVSGGGSKNYNSSVTVEAVLASATGYTYAFDGWYNGSTKVSSDLSYTFTMPASAVALTAVGTRAANPYTVEFNANGGTGTMQPQDFVYDTAQDLDTNAFTRTGYTFLGWSTDPNAATPTYTDGQNVSNLAPSGTITLYAIWRLNTYLLSITETRSTVVVNRTSSPLGGGTIGPLGSGATLYYNDSLTITFTADTGYSMTVQTVNGEDFASGSPHTVTAAVTVVSTAVANTYSVVFNANRGTGIGTGTMANQSFTYDQAQALTANAYTRQIPVTFNYAGGIGTPASSPAVSVFNGWARSADGAAVFTDGQSVSNLTAAANGTVTLFAKWANGNVTLPTPTRTGYTFKGWYSEATGGTKIGNGGDTYSPTAPVTIFAQWTIIEYTLDLTASDNGLVVNVLRSASPIGGGDSGLLSNGATLYYNDVVTITYSISQGYQLETATVNGEDISVEGRKTVTVTGNLVVVITVDLGAIVYIGNEAYQAFIGDGTSYSQYEAFFGNGSGYDPY